MMAPLHRLGPLSTPDLPVDRHREDLVTDSAFTAFDHLCMAQALRLAERGAYTTKPNPMVGCVLAQGPVRPVCAQGSRVT